MLMAVTDSISKFSITLDRQKAIDIRRYVAAPELS